MQESQVGGAGSSEISWRLEGECTVSGLVLIVILVWVVLMVFLSAGTLWFQGYIYSEPAEGMYWRAPAAGTVLTLLVVLWCRLDYGSPGQYPALFDFSPTEEKEFPELWAVKDGKTTLYKLKKDAAGHSEYQDANGKPLPSHRDAILVKEDGQEVRFEAERNEKGQYKITPGQSLRYLEKDGRGRVMTEDSMGRVGEFRWGLTVANFMLSLLHFLAWFGCLWLLLRFQWAHALGLAVIFWLVMTLVILPMLLTRVEEVSRKQAVSEPMALGLEHRPFQRSAVGFSPSTSRQ
jgi:hypothetical protein